MGSLSSCDAQARPSPNEAGRKVSGVRGLDFRLNALRSTAELARYSDSQLRPLLQYVDEVVVQEGFQVAVEGQLCSQFLIVAEGRLRAVSLRGGGHTLEAGDSWGWNAMWKRSVNDATMVAETDTRLLVMGHAQFRAVKAVAGRFL
jgi:CRP-like cAMP-binding protein